MTRSREERQRVLRALLDLDEPLDSVLAGVAMLSWDIDEELVVLRPVHIINVLKRFLTGGLTASEIERWANTIEGRDGIALDDKTAPLLKEAIFDLANPSLQEAITPESAIRWIKRLCGSGA